MENIGVYEYFCPRSVYVRTNLRNQQLCIIVAYIINNYVKLFISQQLCIIVAYILNNYVKLFISQQLCIIVTLDEQLCIIVVK